MSVPNNPHPSGGQSGSGRAHLWTKDFILAWIAGLCLSMTFYVLMTSMAGYAVTRFGAGQATAGLASSSFVIGAVLGRIIVSKYLDFIGRKRLIVGVLAAFVVCAVLYAVAAPVAVLIVLRLIHGVGYGLGHTALMTAAQSLLPDARRGEGTGYFAMSASLATAVGPLVAVFLVSAFGYGWLFGTVAAFSLAGFLVMLFVRLPERTPTAGEVAEKWRLTPASIVEPRALPVSLVIFLAGMAYSAVLAFLATYTDAQGMGNASSVFFLLYAIVTVASRLFAGRLQDRFGDAVVIYPAMVLFALGLAALALAHSVALVAVAAVLMGAGFGSAMPALQTAAVKVVEPARVGVAMSTFFLLLDVGTGIGPVALGALQPVLPGGGIYWCAAAIVTVSIAVYAAVGRNACRVGT